MLCKRYPVTWEKIPIGSKNVISQITRTEIKIKLNDPTYASTANDSNAKGAGDGLKKLLAYCETDKSNLSKLIFHICNFKCLHNLNIINIYLNC